MRKLKFLVVYTFSKALALGTLSIIYACNSGEPHLFMERDRGDNFPQGSYLYHNSNTDMVVVVHSDSSPLSEQEEADRLRYLKDCDDLFKDKKKLMEDANKLFFGNTLNEDRINKIGNELSFTWNIKEHGKFYGRVFKFIRGDTSFDHMHHGSLITIPVPMEKLELFSNFREWAFSKFFIRSSLDKFAFENLGLNQEHVNEFKSFVIINFCINLLFNPTILDGVTMITLKNLLDKVISNRINKDHEISILSIAHTNGGWDLSLCYLLEKLGYKINLLCVEPDYLNTSDNLSQFEWLKELCFSSANKATWKWQVKDLKSFITTLLENRKTFDLVLVRNTQFFNKEMPLVSMAYSDSSLLARLVDYGIVYIEGFENPNDYGSALEKITLTSCQIHSRPERYCKNCNEKKVKFGRSLIKMQGQYDLLIPFGTSILTEEVILADFGTIPLKPRFTSSEEQSKYNYRVARICRVVHPGIFIASVAALNAFLKSKEELRGFLD